MRKQAQEITLAAEKPDELVGRAMSLGQGDGFLQHYRPSENRSAE
jgi:hypothetical protein